MAQLPPHRRKAVVIASSTAVLASGLLLLNESHGGGVNSMGQFALGAVVGIAVGGAIFFFLKSRSGPRPGDKP